MKYKSFVAGMVLLATPFSSALAQNNPFATNAPANPFATAQTDRYAGVFQSDAVRLTLANSGPKFTGELYYTATNATYPLTATHSDNKLNGAFIAGGANFSFTFTLTPDGKNGTFDTENFNSTLGRISGLQGSANTIKPLSQAEEIINEALEIAKALPADKKSSAIYSIINLKAALGDIDGARELLKTMPGTNFFRDYAIQGIAGGQLTHDDLNGALKTANTISKPALRTRFDGQIASYHIKQGDVAKGLAVARNQSSPADRVTALLAAASALKLAGDMGQAKSVMGEARAAALLISDETSRNSSLFSIIFTYITLEDIQTALALTNSMPISLTNMILYKSIANAKIKAGDRAGGRAIADKALKASKQLKPKALRPSAYLQLVDVYIHLGDSDVVGLAARKSGADSMDTIMSAVTLAKINHKQFDSARSWISLSGDTILKNALTFAVVMDQAERGDIDGALATARAESNPEQRVSMLTTIAGFVHEGEK